MGPFFALLAVTLAADPEAGVLHIATSPPGAAITLDGVLVGLSPRSETVRPGVHTLTAEQAGALTTQTISLAAGEARKVVLTLVARPAARPLPVSGLVTFGAGALCLGLGLLLQAPARAAGLEMRRLFEQGGGWDEPARKLEAEGLSAQTWSWFFTAAGVAVMASGVVVGLLQLFGAPPELPALVLVPTSGGGLLSWGGRW